ncbi:class II glutamine amidotransferase [Thermococcus kodakarensis]|nr:class II glutamine amidotransferase [Thermococcus kodakarensis]WCN28999.1 class II glutamine amidotransferase [Thermococcus kodakarensis]WCN31304.1 class II glutamine amidotransferase [Thermococcus kodakarensis]
MSENMCRILFARGIGQEVAPLFDALIKSAQNDPYREKRNKKTQHPDGWGYVLLREENVTHYRSVLPIFNDPNAENLLNSLTEEDSQVVLMAHARAASQGGKTLFNVQPFQFSTRHGFSFWFMHNGDLDKEALIWKAGFKGEELVNASDSYVFAAYLSKTIDNITPEEISRRFVLGLETTRTTLNTGTLFLLPDGSWSAFITAYMVNKYTNSLDDWNYARLIELKANDLYAVASSTLELYHEARWRTLNNGTAISISGDKIERFSLGDACGP